MESAQDLFARHDFCGIVTRDPEMRALLETVTQVAKSDAIVLIQGETGTGKELIARALHANGARRGGPLATVLCGSLPDTLLDSELFGHSAGAFTGAVHARSGRFAAAHGGTLFLDEVAELPLSTQAKLLRFLQFGEIQRLGVDAPETIDVRVIAATHAGLETRVKEGTFREDLFHRLRVIELRVPPLRERKADIPLLIDHFSRRFFAKRPQLPRWSLEARQALQNHEYPGNVRELENIVLRCSVLAREDVLGMELLPPEVRPPLGARLEGRFEKYTNDELRLARMSAVAKAEREFLEGLMTRSQGNLSRAARESGLTRGYLQRLLTRHSLRGARQNRSA